MTSVTQEVISLLKHRNMTGKELIIELGVEDEPNLVHCVLTALKKRKAVVCVGKSVEVIMTKTELLQRSLYNIAKYDFDTPRS